MFYKYKASLPTNLGLPKFHYGSQCVLNLITLF